MYYERYQPRRKRRRRERPPFGRWLAGGLLRLLLLALVLAVLAGGVLYILPVTFFSVEPEGVELSLTDGLPAGRAHVLLLGRDAVREGVQRSDTIIIASIGMGSLRLTSVLRDTVMEIPGYGRAKLNAAYARGGPELVMRTLNQNLGLNIMHYVSVDFTALVKLVDAMGGVDVELTEKEIEYINELIESRRGAISARGYTTGEVVSSGGTAHLDGVQALAFARMRKLDSDFGRSNRQRKVLSAMLRRIRENFWNPLRDAAVLRAFAEGVETNMSLAQLISYGEKALAAGTPEQLRLPANNTYTDDGSSLTVNDWPANTAAFLSFAYAPKAP